MFDHLNTSAFLMLNGPAHPGSAMLFVARAAAAWGIYLVAVLMVLGWVRGGLGLRRVLFHAGLAAALGLAVNWSIASFYFHPRPFAAGIGHQLLPHAPDSSFPSDHATILFAVALSLLFDNARGLWGWLALLVALGAAWARVYMGVHWPLDMAGAACVGGLAAWIVHVFARRTRAGLAGRLSRFYDRVLDLAHLPAGLFPRAR